MKPPEKALGDIPVQHIGTAPRRITVLPTQWTVLPKHVREQREHDHLAKLRINMRQHAAWRDAAWPIPARHCTETTKLPIAPL
jgi:hypothetical protein